MNTPPYLLTRPPLDLAPQMRAAFDALFATSVEGGQGDFIAYRLTAPKWQFLSYLAETKPILLHGTGDTKIEEFVPRKSYDLHEFGAQTAVYATSDGIWPMYYAILDRDRYPSMTLHNACIHLRDASGEVGGPFYFFSISQSALDHQPWRTGVVYVLPRATFVQEPEMDYGGLKVIVSQWMSTVAVKPLAKLTVQPEDFPFLAAIRGHDDAVLQARIAADPAGFPWVD